MRGETTSKAAVIARNGADNEGVGRRLPDPVSPGALTSSPNTTAL
ncbi:hypothetical protein SAMN05414139_02292 [Burkholderia sp. D7]|nr:hypothetical protein SAMN05414139_02292 [Burkholderia sp. D7]